MQKNQTVTNMKTKQKGKYLRPDRTYRSIELVYVQWDGDNFESRISPTLLLENQWNPRLQPV
jgi:hypothetical protein